MKPCATCRGTKLRRVSALSRRPARPGRLRSVGPSTREPSGGPATTIGAFRECSHGRDVGLTSCSREATSGYRVYFVRKGRMVIVLLAGGDKTTQAADIKTALRLARNL